MESDPIKSYISHWLEIDNRNLNEISIDDVTFSDPARQDINRCVAPLLALEETGDELFDAGAEDPDTLPCKTFWVEDTFELILFVWIGTRAKTVVVESDDWRLRDDISIH